MWKILIIVVAAFLLYKMFMGDKQKKEKTQKKVLKEKVASGEMVKDPICGTYVEASSDIRVRQGETVHRFCSYECRDKYLKQLDATDVTPEAAKQEE